VRAHRTRRLAVVSFSLALLGAGVVGGPSAGAAPAPTAAAAVPCLAGAGRSTPARGHADTPAVSAATKRAVAAAIRSTSAPALAHARTSGSTVAPLPAQIQVPVQIHVIHGRHRADRKVSRTQARRLFYTLRAGFNGRQNPEMAPTGIIFVLNKITISRNDSWFHAKPGSRADRSMKRKLHRGKRRVLNVYLNDARSQGQALLGFARFPWLAGRYPQIDGVTINVSSLPGGKARGYNLGDTIIHETGHWLGLFHTFEGGCQAPGDYVADTAAEGEPSFTCPRTRDTCPTEVPVDALPGTPPPAPVFDPVTNFMDYSYDSCMNNFTPGQRTRMMTSFMRYRYGR
jgi:hypothetical protein